MASILSDHDFRPVIDKNMQEFYDKFEQANMKTYDEVTKKYTDQFINLQSQGVELDQAA